MQNEHDYLATAPFDLYELHLFNLVVKHRSFTRAAEAAGLTQTTVSDFEIGKTKPHESTRAVIQTALEDRGIVFTNGDMPGFYFNKNKDKVITPT